MDELSDDLLKKLLARKLVQKVGVKLIEDGFSTKSVNLTTRLLHVVEEEMEKEHMTVAETIMAVLHLAAGSIEPMAEEKYGFSRTDVCKLAATLMHSLMLMHDKMDKTAAPAEEAAPAAESAHE